MKNNKVRNAIVIITSLIVAVILIVIIVGLSIPAQKEIIQGFVETTDYRISSKVTSRVAEIRVREGQYVAKGDTLAIMEAPEMETKLRQAQAAYQASLAQEQKALAGSRQEQISAAYQQWQKAIAGKEVAEKTYARVQRLFDQGVLPEQKLDEARAQYDSMVATERAARSQYEMAQNGARIEDKAAAAAQTLRAQGAVDEINTYLDETVVLSPVSGQVTEIFPERGELVGAGAPIMNVAVPHEAWFTFNVREDLLPGLSVGTDVNVYVPAIDRTVKAQITLMKDVGSFAVWKATKALDGYDLKTIEMQAYPIDEKDLEGVRSGMSAVIVRNE
ncbi:MAG: biotin/lipoyl-binding protein [Bacteroidales bacterium]|nr:biotin/lipoyl-binding protein [Bacteroidales bacterium]